MAVRIRLFRRGRKKMAMYDIVVADARAPRDGRFIEKLGNYNPNTDPATIDLNADRAFDWVMNGAQPSDTARNILSRKGVMLRKHLQIGVNKGAITQEEADKRYAEWLTTKEGKESTIADNIAKAKAADAKERLAAETKVKEARAEALAKKQSEMLAAAEAAEAAAKAEEAGEDAEEATEEATEEAPVAEVAPEAEAKEESVAEVKEEEAPKAEKEEAPAADEAKEEPAAEAKEEPEAEAKEEPAAEVKEEEAPKAEKEEAPAAEEAPAEEEKKKEE
jgi:small subunit ribosomal protein S16